MVLDMQPDKLLKDRLELLAGVVVLEPPAVLKPFREVRVVLRPSHPLQVLQGFMEPRLSHVEVEGRRGPGRRTTTAARGM